MGLFDFFKKKGSDQRPEYSDNLKIICQILKESEISNHGYYYDMVMSGSSAYKALKNKSDEEKTLFLLDCFKILGGLHPSKNKLYPLFIHDNGPLNKEHTRNFLTTLIKNHCRSKFLIGNYSNICEVIRTISSEIDKFQGSYDFPVTLLLNKVVNSLDEIKATAQERNQIKKELIALATRGKFSYVKKEIKEFIDKKYDKNNDSKFSSNGPFGEALAKVVDENKSTIDWLTLNLSTLKKVTGSKPKKSFDKVFSEQSDKEKQIHRLAGKHTLEAFIGLKETDFITEHQNNHYSWTSKSDDKDFIEHQNIIKGVIWSLSIFSDKETLEYLYRAGVRSYKKIPSIGQTAQAIGNECVYTLAASRGTTGLSKLVALKLAVKQPSTKKLVDKYLDQESKKRGVTSTELEEMAFSEYGYEAGEKVVLFDDYKLKMSIIGLGKVEQTWIKPDGKEQKTAPSFIKSNSKFSLKLKKTKAEIKEVQRSTTVLRDRLENSYLEDGILEYARFLKNYLNHGVGYQITSTLIWNIINSKDIDVGIWCADHWETVEGKVINTNDDTNIQLWHPLNSGRDLVVAWRQYLLDHKIKQPFKQAYREVYVVTPPEVNTKTYSNRMAAHIIKQHQLNALAAGRGWKHTLIGAWDHGSDCIVRKQLPKYDINCQFWLVDEGYSDDTTDAGVMLYLGTDQVRFEKEGSPMDVEDVPKIVFSETMRDVDLFVGVASVGNDPEWSDNQGDSQRRSYWASYSFGDLIEVAKTRKEVLQILVPRLKISDVAKIEDKWLLVKGKIRSYKIHLGSTNILMTPNDQYLCIVPDGRKKDAKVFLPFEGDRGLSIIISKALLLADDDKIKDQTIVRQISRKI